MTTPATRFALATISLAAEQIILADGTLWSHAATMGTYQKGGEFTIDRKVLENFIKVFSTGHPRKIPVDYEHASTSGDPEVRKLRAQGMVPKAGDVAELKGVFSAADFTGDLKAAAEKLAAQAGRPLDDPRNFGLWMRWKPTARALAAVKAGEYTELSIAFESDVPHNETGEGQGPGLLAVALCNMPHLTDMLPVAASSDAGRSPAAPGSHEGVMTKLTVLSVAAAVLGKAHASEDEALNELNGLVPQITELKALRESRDIVSAEFGNEKDPTKVVGQIRELRAQVKTATDAAAAQKKAAVKATVDATIKQYENRLGNKPLAERLTRDLTAELEGGATVENAPTVAILKSLTVDPKFVRNAGADNGENATAEKKVVARAEEFMRTDEEVKQLAKTNRHAAYNMAVDKAEAELLADSTK